MVQAARFSLTLSVQLHYSPPDQLTEWKSDRNGVLLTTSGLECSVLLVLQHHGSTWEVTATVESVVRGCVQCNLITSSGATQLH